MRTERRPPLLLLSALGLSVGLLAAFLLSAPRVVAVQPAPSMEGARALASISIEFSQSMREETVESRLRLTPSRPGAFRWDGRRVTFTPSQPWAAGTTVEAVLEAGALSRRGLPVLAPTRWSFTIGAGRLAYLWPSDGPAALYAWSESSAEPERLATAALGILDFDVTADASAIVYAAATPDGTEIRRLGLDGGGSELLHRCPAGSVCRRPTLSPDGDLLAYVREDRQADGSMLRRVWMQAVGGGSPYTVAPEDHATSQPAWSSQGWLAVYDHTLAAYALYDVVSAEAARLAFVVPNGLGEPPAWSPDGEWLVFAEIVFLPETSPDDEDPPRFYSHLKRVSIQDGQVVDLSGDETMLVEDSGPAYAPDAGWIAFARRSLDPAEWTIGRQLWLVRPDGSEGTRLTAVAEMNHGGIAWSPDSSRLAYIVFDQTEPTAPAELWWRWSDGREGGLVAVGGYAPAWIP